MAKTIVVPECKTASDYGCRMYRWKGRCECTKVKRKVATFYIKAIVVSK